MQFVSVLLRSLPIFGGPELFKISKAIDLSCQSIQNARAQAVWQPRLPGVKKAEHQTVSSKANPSTPFGTILAVKTVQARDKPAHRSHQAPDVGNTTRSRPQELTFRKTYDLEGSRIEVGGKSGAFWGLGKTAILVQNV